MLEPKRAVIDRPYRRHLVLIHLLYTTLVAVYSKGAAEREFGDGFARVAAERTMQLSSGILGVGVAAVSLSSGVEGLRRFERFLGGQPLAAAPSPVLTILGTSAVLVLGFWLCIVFIRHRWARFSLILAWSGAALVLAVLFHLNHAGYAAACRGQAAAQTPLDRRCIELQQRGRL